MSIKSIKTTSITLMGETRIVNFDSVFVGTNTISVTSSDMDNIFTFDDDYTAISGFIRFEGEKFFFEACVKADYDQYILILCGSSLYIKGGREVAVPRVSRSALLRVEDQQVLVGLDVKSYGNSLVIKSCPELAGLQAYLASGVDHLDYCPTQSVSVGIKFSGESFMYFRISCLLGIFGDVLLVS